MEQYTPKINDIVTINATIVGITASNNYIIQIGSGNRFLIKFSDINTIHPYQPIPETDARKGN